MGNKNSAEKMISAEFQRRAPLAAEIKPKELFKVYQKCIELYPFVEGVRESICVADNTLPDCPLVYVNEIFESITGYPRELCLGRNCRFLQGKYTSKETVKKARAAIDKGDSVELEILNYRRDGSAFFNSFIMLPVRMKKKEKVPHYFVAVQKDVTQLKLELTSVNQWTPVEVALHFERYGLGQYGHAILENSVSGRRLLRNTELSMQKIGVAFDDDREEILQLVADLRDDLSTMSTGANASDTFGNEYWNAPRPSGQASDANTNGSMSVLQKAQSAYAAAGDALNETNMGVGQSSRGAMRGLFMGGQAAQHEQDRQRSDQAAAQVYNAVLSAGIMQPALVAKGKRNPKEVATASADDEEDAMQLEVPAVASVWRRAVAGNDSNAPPSPSAAGAGAGGRARGDDALTGENEILVIKLFLSTSPSVPSELLRVPRAAPLKKLMKRVRRTLQLSRVRLQWRCPTANGSYVLSALESETAYRMAKSAVGDSIMEVTVEADAGVVASEDEAALMDAFYAPMMISDADGVVIKANAAVTAQLGYAAAQVLDANLVLTDIFPHLNFLNRRNRSELTRVRFGGSAAGALCSAVVSLQFNAKSTTAVVIPFTAQILERLDNGGAGGGGTLAVTLDGTGLVAAPTVGTLRRAGKQKPAPRRSRANDASASASGSEASSGGRRRRRADSLALRNSRSPRQQASSPAPAGNIYDHLPKDLAEPTKKVYAADATRDLMLQREAERDDARLHKADSERATKHHKSKDKSLKRSHRSGGGDAPKKPADPGDRRSQHMEAPPITASPPS